MCLTEICNNNIQGEVFRHPNYTHTHYFVIVRVLAHEYNSKLISYVNILMNDKYRQPNN